MTDLEIYIDALINLQIQTINSALDAVRQQLSEQFHPNNDDYYMRLLDVSHIEDDDYFLNIIQNDLEAVISDIRAHHRKDTETLSSGEIQTRHALFQCSGRYKSEARLSRKGRKK